MIKRHWLIGALAFFPFFTTAQNLIDTIETKIKKTEIELVYNHYLQDGNNSAITGGIGTEELTVYGSSLSVKRTSGKNSYTLNTGSDILSLLLLPTILILWFLLRRLWMQGLMPM